VNLKAFNQIFGGEVKESKTLSGPIGMAKIYGDDFSWTRFWSITGLLIILTAFWEILPLPKTSFWQFLPLISELFGRKMHLNTYRIILRIPYYLWFGLLFYAIFSDIIEEIL